MKNGTNGSSHGSIDVGAVRAKFQAMREGLKAAFKEREDAIECMSLAALSGGHALLVGPPGTAKSALFFSFLSSFPDARRFQTLVTRFATEDEMFGPVKLSALKNDTWERNLDGRLAAVECAFVDEVFKGSDSILNALLSAMNERLYKGRAIPLRMMVGASNELPEEEVLAAVYDRFLLRDVVEYVAADSTWLELMSTPPTFTATGAVTLDEWDAARADVERVQIPERVVQELLRVKNELKVHGVVASDRRWMALTMVLRAAAWIEGGTEVELDHLAVLRFGLWQKPEDRSRVRAVLDTVDRSVVAKAVDIVDGALRAYAHRPTEPSAYLEVLPKLAAEVTDAAKRVQAQLQGGVSRRAQSRIQPKLDELKRAHDSLKSDLARRYSL